MSIMPIDYNDPRYSALARRYEGMYGLPTGILDAIRNFGERSNANQISEAGAQTPYQFIPQTRKGMLKNYGVDPWAGADEATKAAALLVKENHERAGSWDDAVKMYHGGVDRRNWGPRTRAYAGRVGSFDQPEGEVPLGQSRFPLGYYGQDPLAPLPEPTAIPERPKDTAPVTDDLGPSTPIPAAAPAAARKRGGILGALESIFMPDPDSRWAAALRGGIYDAKANQAAYKAGVAKQQMEQDLAQAKLKQLITKGEYQIVGNNVFHIPADGSPAEIITPPQTMGEKERLIDKWSRMDDADPAKALIEQMLTGANSDAALQSKENVARIRAGATTGAARIRANAPSKSSTKQKAPPARFILDK